jgi:phage terminase large subunit GpA-like protein
MDDAKFFSERGIIPDGTVAVTIGVDSQSDGFYWLLACWGRKLETWLPLTGRIVGDLRSDEVWNELATILTRKWLDKQGNAYPSVISALDVQGDHYSQCLEFCRAHGWHRLRAVRGYARSKAGYTRAFGILRNRYTDKATGVTVTNIDVDIAKSQLVSMLKRRDPICVHLPCGPNGEDCGGWTAEAAAELESEFRRETNKDGYTVTRWHKRPGRPNHRLDCFVYSLGALAISRLKIDDCSLQRVEARNVGKPEQEKDHKQSPFGARRMIATGDLASNDLAIGGATGFGVAQRPGKTGFGPLPGSGVSF